MLRGTALRDALELHPLHRLRQPVGVCRRRQRTERPRAVNGVLGRVDVDDARRPRGHVRRRRAVSDPRAQCRRSRSCRCSSALAVEAAGDGDDVADDAGPRRPARSRRSFPGTTALAGVDFASTAAACTRSSARTAPASPRCVKILAGVEQPTSGELLLDGAAHAVRLGA